MPQAAGSQRIVVLVAAVLIAGGAIVLERQDGWRLAALWLVGVGLGVALRHGAFGFTQGFRLLLRDGRGAHVRAQLLMLGAAVCLIMPVIEMGGLLGLPARGFVFPPGVAVAIGAFLFGIGMQLGGGCASGTLYTVTGGSVRMLLTLGFFVAGATLAAWAAPLWSDLPAPPPVSLPAAIGFGPTLLLHGVVFAALWWVTVRIELARHGAVEPIATTPRAAGPGAAWLHGPWPYAHAALALAVLNLATVLLAGRPWAITASFALWGSLAVDGAGLDDPVFWPYWEEPTRVEALFRPLLADVNTVMIGGLVLGALLAAGLSRSFAPSRRLPGAQAAASMLGGLLLGIGAIMASGCNVSAFFSGVASGSLHGWLWIAAALPGNWVGTRLRPLFGLDTPLSAV